MQTYEILKNCIEANLHSANSLRNPKGQKEKVKINRILKLGRKKEKIIKSLPLQ